MSDILSIGKSALSAAQVGLATTGHNIANASTPGYSRQVVVQAAAQAQNFGYGFVGQGTEVAAVTRSYNEILNKQMINSQAVSTSSTIYSSNLNKLDNMLSDASAGINPAITDFFSSVNDLAASPSDIPTRQSMLSNAQSLVNRLQSTSNRLNEVRNDINTQISGSVNLVNTYARQISALNNSIETAISNDGNPANDLMDQRDQLVLELSKQIKTTVVPQGQGSYNIYVGNGLPLVIGKDIMSLTTANSPTDSGQLEVAYQTSGKSTILGASSLPGGVIGGLLQFRSESLDSIQNQVGQLSLVLADTFNTQLKQGVDLNGNPGGNLFNIPAPVVSSNVNNNITSNAIVNSQIVDARAITSSDYRLQYDTSLSPNPYKITRLSDSTVQTFSALPQTVDGLSFGLTSGAFTNGDDFVIRATRNAATTINLAITDARKLAIGSATLSAVAKTTNSGTASISTPPAGSTLTGQLGLTYSTGAPGTFALAPSASAVTVTVSGVPTTYAAGTAIPYTSGATIAVGGLSFAISGTPANGDKFTISPSGPSDNRNGLLLAGLQNQGTLNNSTTSYSSAFSQLVNGVGNKTHELNITAASEASVLEQATAAVQSESGVNLDEEATNLLRYQQAYQAAGKMMQIASQLFDTLLQLGR
ncbi:MAG: flagellar hook-associated protein FlgK [Betaproteobacteria bacterium]